MATPDRERQRRDEERQRDQREEKDRAGKLERDSADEAGRRERDGTSGAADDRSAVLLPEMRLELVPIRVSDPDRGKEFYQRAGFTFNVDVKPNESMRVIQFTPPGSACSIVFGTGMGDLTDMKTGPVKGLHLVVADVGRARDALLQRGVDVGEITDFGGVKYAGFSDPDENTWTLQEFPADLRRPGQSFYEKGTSSQ